MDTKPTRPRLGFSAAGSVASASFASRFSLFGFDLVGHDCNTRILANKNLDIQHISPPATSSAYSDFIYDFVIDKCDFYVPFLDQELLACALLAEKSGKFANKICISNSRAIKECADKLRLKDIAKSLNIPTVPNTTSVPAFIKPRSGSGGKQSLLLSQQSLLDSFLQYDYANEYMIEEYLEGEVVSVDSLWRKDNSLIEECCRIRSSSSGVSTCSRLLKVPRVEELIRSYNKKIGKELGFAGLISIQYIIEDTQPLMLEINPRMGGSILHSHLLGSTILERFLIEFVDEWSNTLNQSEAASAREVVRFYADELLR